MVTHRLDEPAERRAPGTRRDGQVSYGTRDGPLRAAAVRP